MWDLTVRGGFGLKEVTCSHIITAMCSYRLRQNRTLQEGRNRGRGAGIRPRLSRSPLLGRGNNAVRRDWLLLEIDLATATSCGWRDRPKRCGSTWAGGHQREDSLGRGAAETKPFAPATAYLQLRVCSTPPAFSATATPWSPSSPPNPSCCLPLMGGFCPPAKARRLHKVIFNNKSPDGSTSGFTSIGGDPRRPTLVG